MTALAILVASALLLFGGSFFSKRRFGLLGMALAVGYVLSLLWHETVEFMVRASGLVSAGVVSHFVATVILILLPVLFLFFHGVSYKTVTGRVAGSLLFTLLALGFLIEPMTTAFIVEGPSAGVFQWLSGNAKLIIGVGVMAAVLDMCVARLTAPINRRGKK